MSTQETQSLKTEAAGEFSFELSKFITFRDREACERVRRIKKGEITKHPNPEFRIRVIEDPHSFYFEFASSLSRGFAARSRPGRNSWPSCLWGLHLNTSWPPE